MKTAVVLFNLGGPDSLDAVRPFLFNLFSDPAILRLPQPLRWALARLISSRRAPVAREIYEKMGGRSPLLPQTQAQARALEVQLADLGEVRAFIAMRYWHPFAAAALAEIQAFKPDRIVLLPLYPQFSTTTTGSSLAEWKRLARRAGVSAPTHAVCCYPLQAGFIAALAELVAPRLDEAAARGPVRLLFSAHGLPKKVVAAGDPYAWQVRRTAEAVVAALGRDDLDWLLSFQSRVGPMEWIAPFTDVEIERAAREGKALVVVPLAFVSEHSETLVELDIEYRHLAEAKGAAGYWRVPAVGVHPAFIGGLADLVRQSLTEAGGVAGEGLKRLCTEEFSACACGRAGL